MEKTFGTLLALFVTASINCWAVAWEGTDNFTSGILTNWTVYQNASGTMIVTATNGHASFTTTPSSTSEQQAILLWKGTPSVLEDWTADVTGYNGANYSENGSSQLQLWVINMSTSKGIRVAMSRDAFGQIFNTKNESGTLRQSVTASNANFGLRLVYHASAQQIEAWYDSGGTGSNWSKLDTIDLTNFSPGMTSTDLFTVALIGDTYFAPVFEGQLFADNFHLTNSTPLITTNSTDSQIRLGITAIYAQTWLTNGLVAYYPFNENANDASGSGSNGIVIGASLITNRFGIPNSAYLFSGAPNWIQTSNFWPVLGSNAVTVSCWINYAGGVPRPWAESTMLNWGGSDVFGSRFQFRLADGGNGVTTMCLDGGGAVSQAETSIPSNTWIHLTVVKPFNGGLNDTIFYVNGQVVPTQPGSDSSYKFDFVATDSLTLGSGQLTDTSESRFFNGGLDEFRIYKRTLSSNEVAQLYALESSPVTLSFQKAIYLTSANLHSGDIYQLQISSDLINWTSYGAVFTATSPNWRSTNYWDVDSKNQLFFRLQQQ